ncbi:MAG: sodium:solute symporter, partial [Gammaproteobacteria bacterium]
ASALLLTIIAIYTMWGGLIAVAWTDTFMVIGMAIASIYMVTQIFTDISLGEMIQQLRAIDESYTQPETSTPYGESKASVFLVFAYAMIFSTALPYMSVRFMAMKSGISIARTGIYTAVLGCILSMVPLVGLYVRLKNPDLTTADNAMPWYLANIPPMLVGSVITLFIIFAMKSTANSILHTLSTAVSHDLRQALFIHSHPPGKQVLLLNRLWVVLVAMIGFAATFFLPEVMLNFLGIFSSGTLMASLSGVMLVSIVYTGTMPGALASMVAGAVTSIYLLTSGIVGWVEGPLLGVVASAVVYIIVSMLTKPKNA